MREETFELPWPNSDNNHHKPVVRKIGGKLVPAKILTKEARTYRTLVKMMLGFRHPDKRWNCPIEIWVDLYPPRKGCDTNNYWKSLQDALTAAGVWSDDVLIVASHARRHRPLGRDAKVRVTLKEVVDLG